MSALDDGVAILNERHDAIVAAFGLAERQAVVEALAGEALSELGIAAVAAEIPATELPSFRLILAVVAWRWVEEQAAFAFDFSADGGSYRRGQLMQNATEMRRRAEERVAAAGLLAFGQPGLVVEMVELWPQERYP